MYTTPEKTITSGKDANGILSPVLHEKYLLILVCTDPQKAGPNAVELQEKAKKILDGQEVQYLTFDGADSTNQEQCEYLFSLSGQRQYPQFFVVDQTDAEQNTTFWGGWDKFYELSQVDGAIAEEFGDEFGDLSYILQTPGSFKLQTPSTGKTSSSSKKKRSKKKRKNSAIKSGDTPEQEIRSKDLNVAFTKDTNGKGHERASTEPKTDAEDEPNYTHWAVSGIILILFTSIVLAIPLAIQFGSPEDKRQMKQMIQQPFVPEEWRSVQDRIARLFDEDEDGISENVEVPEKQDGSPDYWNNPLDGMDFASKVFSEPYNADARDSPEDVLRDPFDMFEGMWDADKARKDFFKSAAMFFKDQKKSSDDLNFEQLITNLLAPKTDASKQIHSKSFLDVIKTLTDSTSEVMRQMNETLGHVGLDRFNLLQFLYFMDYEEIRLNSVYKRRVHRFQPELSLDAAIQLYDGLYLSQLAYAQSCDTINEHLKTFRGGMFTLRNCTTESSIHRPAHFVIVRKMSAVFAGEELNFVKKRGPLAWLSMSKNLFRPKSMPLEVAVVVRGSKEIFDFLTDGMLQATDYMGGKAHEGILKSAEWLEKEYAADLKQFWLSTKKKHKNNKMKLWCVGHSLGAGAAALLTMNMRQNPAYKKWVEAESIGYGTPSLVSPMISYQFRDYVTTVVNDADLVPRTSGAAMANTWLKIVAYNWTQPALEDFDLLVDSLKQDNNLMNLFFRKASSRLWLDDTLEKLRSWLEGWFDDNVSPWLQDLPPAVHEGEAEVELIPPGDCVHLYRDGTKFSANYVNCSSFGNGLEVVRHFVDDHLIPVSEFQSKSLCFQKASQ